MGDLSQILQRHRRGLLRLATFSAVVAFAATSLDARLFASAADAIDGSLYIARQDHNLREGITYSELSALYGTAEFDQIVEEAEQSALRECREIEHAHEDADAPPPSTILEPGIWGDPPPTPRCGERTWVDYALAAVGRRNQAIEKTTRAIGQVSMYTAVAGIGVPAFLALLLWLISPFLRKQ